MSFLGYKVSGCRSTSSCEPCAAPVVHARAEPDTRKFIVEDVVEMGPHVVARVRYPDAKNYEGLKILILANTTSEEIRKLDFLDPHFCEGSHISPVARFEPTARGWKLALHTAALLASEK